MKAPNLLPTLPDKKRMTHVLTQYCYGQYELGAKPEDIIAALEDVLHAERAFYAMKEINNVR